jgi:hypothetical protein
MNYLVPFSSLKQSVRFISAKGNLKADLAYDEFIELIRKLLMAIPVDEAWYRTEYPDVAAAIDAGAYTSATSHFVDHGYLEGRRPFQVKVDEAYYIAQNQDVHDGLANGTIASAQEHFDRHGYAEGRAPAPSV